MKRQSFDVCSGASDRIHSDEPIITDLLIGGNGRVDSFGDKHVESAGIDTKRGELAQAEGRHPQRRDHQRDALVRLKNGGGSLVTVREASVSRLRLMESSVGQVSDSERP